MLTEQQVEKIPVFQRTSLSDAIVTSAPGMIRGHDDFVHVRGHEIALRSSTASPSGKTRTPSFPPASVLT
jgi:hypothetical protein